MYSTNNEGKSVVGERFTRTLKNKINKQMTSKSKIVHIDKLDEIANKQNNTYHNANKIKPANVKDNTYIDFYKKNQKEDPKFKAGNHIRISKYKTFFAKGYTSKLSEEVCFCDYKSQNHCSVDICYQLF